MFTLSIVEGFDSNLPRAICAICAKGATLPARWPCCLHSFTSFTSSISFTSCCLHTLLQKPKSQPFCFHAIPHSFTKTPGVGGTASHARSAFREVRPPFQRGKNETANCYFRCSICSLH